jgi:DNA-binding response OmpR family regulator
MKKILLVDDDKDLSQSLERALKAHGYDVTLAFSATEGLRKARAIKPDAIILDVLMETDTAGFEFIYQIRSMDKGSRYKEVRDTPILLHTAINRVTNFRFSLNERISYLPSNSGMLTKPVPIDLLLNRLSRMLSPALAVAGD